MEWTEDQCRSKWKNLRDAYSRFVAAQKKHVSGSGAKKIKPYLYADLLKFLDPFFTDRER